MTNISVESDNLALAQKFIDAYNDLGNGTEDLATAVNALTDLMTEDAVMEIPLLGVTQTSRFENTASASGIANYVSTRHIDVKRMLVCEDGVAVEMLWWGISRGGPGMAPEGERVEMENCIVFTMRDGLISRYCEYVGRVKGIDLSELH